MSVTDKVIIVTGASSGIGLGVTKHLVENGAKVVGLDINPFPDNLAASSAANFVFRRTDLTAAGAADEAAALAIEKFGGRIDGLANIAGAMDNMASVDLVDDSIYERVMAVNLTAPIRLMRAVVGTMRAQGGGGSIVNMSSKSGTSGATAGVAYTASKHAILGATKNVAWRFQKEGIRCNAVLPGAVDTGFFNLPQPVDKEGMERYAGFTELHLDCGGKMDPKEVAPLVAFLLSDSSKMINGAQVPIDQAWSTT